MARRRIIQLPDYSQKLSEEDVREIRRKWASGNYTQKELAEEYGVSRSWMSSVCRRRNAWVNV